MSGHIHELRIHVPWTKLGSEPVVITINTMECILKLKDGAQVSHSLVNGMGSFCETCSKAIQQTERDTQAFKLCFVTYVIFPLMLMRSFLFFLT